LVVDRTNFGAALAEACAPEAAGAFWMQPLMVIVFEALDCADGAGCCGLPGAPGDDVGGAC
jgi:hypothetical protein